MVILPAHSSSAYMYACKQWLMPTLDNSCQHIRAWNSVVRDKRVFLECFWGLSGRGSILIPRLQIISSMAIGWILRGKSTQLITDHTVFLVRFFKRKPVVKVDNKKRVSPGQGDRHFTLSFDGCVIGGTSERVRGRYSGWDLRSELQCAWMRRDTYSREHRLELPLKTFLVA